MMEPQGKAENNLTIGTYKTKVCPVISITGVFSQSAYLKGEK